MAIRNINTYCLSGRYCLLYCLCLILLLNITLVRRLAEDLLDRVGKTYALAQLQPVSLCDAAEDLIVATASLVATPAQGEVLFEMQLVIMQF